MVKSWIPSASPPATVTDRRVRLIVGRGGGEGASIAGSIGAIYCAQKLTPQKLEGLKTYLADRVILPYIQSFDRMADRVPGIEGEKGIAERQKMPDKERARYFADGLVDFTLQAGGGIVGQSIAQGLLNHMLGMKVEGRPLEKVGKMLTPILVDRGIQIGAMAVLSAGTPQLSEKLQHSVAKNVLKQVGFKDDKEAESLARYLVTWQLPNLMGAFGSVGFLDHAYEKQNPLKGKGA